MRTNAEPLGQLDQREAGAAADIENVLHVGERNLLEKQQTEHGGPQRQLVVRRQYSRRGEIGIERQEIQRFHEKDAIAMLAIP